ncbi:MAG: GDSL-type esterase/lipase family protein [Rubripirellula sp.]
MWYRRILLIAFIACSSSVGLGESPVFPADAKRVLFLGDSITHAGHYITLLESQLRLQGHASEMELLNLGLPSETCSGLSEPEHPFPRPDVRERLDRALAKVKPDVVVACYGMNDGIYYPFSEERFQAYREGIDEIISKVNASGAKLVLMTPPAFDPLPMRQKDRLLALGAEKYSWNAIYEDYDDVMKKYAAWVLAQNDRVEMTIDLHSAVTEYLASKRAVDPGFTMSPDGVHVNKEGQEVIAQAISNAWGLGDLVAPDEGLQTLISRRQQLMHNAWLSEVGHLRPGVKAGKPITEAKAEADELGKQIGPRAQRQLDRQKTEDVHSLHIPASSRSGELSLFVDYDLWIPAGSEPLRGIVVHQHGCGPGASNAGLTAVDDLHWRALAKRWNCALMGSSYEGRAGAACRLWCDPRNGSRDSFLAAIDHFATSTGHEELRTAPWCLWGHSGGGFWASLMQTMHPERVAAVWLQSGTAFGYWESGEVEKPDLTPAVFAVPVMACPGFEEKSHERFHRAWDGLHDMKTAYRRENAPFGIAPDPRTGHECGDSRYLAIPFFDACLQLRLPTGRSPAQALRAIDFTKSRFGDADGNVVAAAERSEASETLSWLPNAEFARAWSSFVRTGNVVDETPPSPPMDVQAVRGPDEVTLRWSAEADFESGIGSFRIERNGNSIAVLPAEPTSRFGRPIFQVMTYSGTPSQPLAEMCFKDAVSVTEGPVTYRVISVNSLGLESEASEIVME